MTAWNPDHIMKVSTNKTPCSCYLTGTTLPWNNDITGEQRLSDCPLKLIRRKKRGKR